MLNVSFLFVLFLSFARVALSVYFVVNTPSKGDKWVNDQVNYVTWTIGRNDQNPVSVFDLELVRLSAEGINYIAKNVPVGAPGLPLELHDVPAGDDYFLVFINSTHGLEYAMSNQFTILSDGSDNGTSIKTPSTKKGQSLLATVTVNGPPNPTNPFIHTFAPTSGSPRTIKISSISAIMVGSVVAAITAL
ncbi:hypothetical protein M422DRAFT_31539 [Sphaerobolus stellatus SS14]|uniref:Yeast cell wall synthesis Kre9/Knh1-like N-terminal domain-containing protein n=1 Tax=Sphaerobolus stellatus (strain SS14) TaxID=990650 RepID=A0A0C9UFW6_SPHS4|nr:hypothetical protein M422DRAFT_31539 [Sphaerobolus stellatus SS14]